MSDAIASSLLSSCKHTLKSLSEALTTLDSIGALSRLREDGEAMEALKIVSEFTQSLLRSSTRSTTAVGPLSGSKTTAVETRNRLEHIPLRHSSTVQDAETQTLENLRVQDGRDGAVIATPAVPNPDPYHRDLLPPTSTPSSGPAQHIYSLLVYFPAFFLSREAVTAKEKRMLLDIILSESGSNTSNAARHLTTTSYPRIRLIHHDMKMNYSPSPRAVLILDDDPERLRRIQKDLHAAQYQRWSNLGENWMRRDLFFVRTWKENPVILIFKFKVWDKVGAAPSLAEQRAMIDVIFHAYPVLAHYQGDTSSSGPRITVGRAASYRGPLYVPYISVGSPTTLQSTCLLVPVFNVDPRYPDAAMLFAQDFAAEHSGGADGLADPENTFHIYVDLMKDPILWSLPGGAAWAADSG